MSISVKLLDQSAARTSGRKQLLPQFGPLGFRGGEKIGGGNKGGQVPGRFTTQGICSFLRFLLSKYTE